MSIVRVTLAVALLLQAGCLKPSNSSETEVEEALAPPESIPKVGDVLGASVVVGFARGRTRNTAQLSQFSISESPVTVAQYGQCVEAGACEEVACTELEGSTGRLSGLGIDHFRWDQASSPASCQSAGQAEAYCAWVGGALPTPAQWMLAARGTQPASYAWGERDPSCEQHPLALAPQLVMDSKDTDSKNMIAKGSEVESPSTASEGAPSPGATLRRRCGEATGEHADVKTAVEVGKYGAAATKGAIQDVLFAGGELLRRDRAGTMAFPACYGDDGICMVYGYQPGLIQGVRAVWNTKAPQPAGAWAFRCVHGAEVSK